MKYTIKGDSNMLNLVGYIRPDSPGFVCFLNKKEKKESENHKDKLEYIPVGPSFPFRFFTTNLKDKPVMNSMLSQPVQKRLRMSNSYSTGLLNAVEWTQEDVAAANDIALEAPFVSTPLGNIANKKASQIKIQDFNLTCNDPLLVAGANSIMTYQPRSLSLEDIDALYTEEITKVMNQFMNDLTKQFDENEDAEEVINPWLIMLQEIQSQIQGIFTTFTKQDKEVWYPKENISSKNFSIQDKEQDPNNALDKRNNMSDIIFQRFQDEENNFFKIKDLASAFNEFSLIFTHFINDFTTLKSYMSEDFGLGVSLFFGARDVHLTKATLHPGVSMNYNSLTSRTIDYIGNPLSRGDFVEFFVNANCSLLEDIFLEVKNIWRKTPYGRSFLNFIYGDLMDQIFNVIKPMYGAMTDASLENMLDEENENQIMQVFLNALKFNPFFLALRNQVRESSKAVAEQFYDAKINDPNLQDLFKTPSSVNMMKNLYTPGLNDNGFVIWNQKTVQVLPQFMFQFGKYIQDNNLLI
jgi:hypothetical protein